MLQFLVFVMYSLCSALATHIEFYEEHPTNHYVTWNQDQEAHSQYYPATQYASFIPRYSFEQQPPQDVYQLSNDFHYEHYNPLRTFHHQRRTPHCNHHRRQQYLQQNPSNSFTRHAEKYNTQTESHLYHLDHNYVPYPVYNLGNPWWQSRFDGTPFEHRRTDPSWSTYRKPVNSVPHNSNYFATSKQHPPFYPQPFVPNKYPPFYPQPFAPPLKSNGYANGHFYTSVNNHQFEHKQEHTNTHYVRVPFTNSMTDYPLNREDGRVPGEILVTPDEDTGLKCDTSKTGCGKIINPESEDSNRVQNVTDIIPAEETGLSIRNQTYKGDFQNKTDLELVSTETGVLSSTIPFEAEEFPGEDRHLEASGKCNATEAQCVGTSMPLHVDQLNATSATSAEEAATSNDNPIFEQPIQSKLDTKINVEVFESNNSTEKVVPNLLVPDAELEASSLHSELLTDDTLLVPEQQTTMPLDADNEAVLNIPQTVE